MKPAVLFARRDSVYKTLPCDVWDIDRDARNFPGGVPIVAHPPCRAWGRLRHFARPRPDEKMLAIFAVEQIRKWGGVLEHPHTSTLWDACQLPPPGARDYLGGFTLPILQWWFGHRAEKPTWLYVCGCDPFDVPPLPFVLGESTHVITQMRTLRDGTRLQKGMPGWRPEVTKHEREATPLKLAEWLIELARRCKPPRRHG